MAYWEFLLQKEGDRSWLPLESPNVEILEGRYRIVARTSRTNTAVEIRVTHIATEEVPPKRRVQKRSHRTNQDGLMVVFPFTRLKPGIWEIYCVGDVMADLLGQGWEQSVQLQVISQFQEEGGDWEPDWQVPTSSEMASEASAASANRADHPVQVTSPAEEPAAEPEPVPTSPVADLSDLWDSPAPTEPTEPSPATELPNVWESPSEAPPVPASPVVPLVSDLWDVPAPVEPSGLTEKLDSSGLEPPVTTAAAGLQLEQPETPAPDVLAEAPLVAPPSRATGESLPVGSTVQEMVTHLLDDVLGTAEDVDALDSGAAVESPSSDISARPELTVANSAFQLLLDQGNFIAPRGQMVLLTGQIDVQTANLGTQNWQSELQVCLRDPQTLQVLNNQCQAIAITGTTTRFTCSVEIPSHCQTRLLLGEISLYSVGAANEASLTPLALQTFTISAALDELLGALPDLGEAQPGDFLPTPEPDLELYASPLGEATETSDLSNLSLVFLDLLKAPKQSTPLQFQPVDSQPLPPQIHRPGAVQPPTRAIQLPSFTRPTEPDPVAPEPPEPEVPMAEETPIAEVEEVEVVPSEAAEPILPASPVEIEATEPPSEPVASEGMTFQSLRLQERFWSRLNAIATDAELSAWLKTGSADEEAELAPPDEPQLPGFDVQPPEEMDAEGFASEAIAAPDASPLPEGSEPEAIALPELELLEDAPVEPEDAWLAREIVVDDDPGEPETPPILQPVLDLETLPPLDEAPAPLPELEVPEGELIAGKQVLVRIRLPQTDSLTHVKVWINDRQTRSLMDGPRWITDFIPNGAGMLETNTYLTVPFGSLEVQFEAIAVLLRNQRESRKVSISRSVVPPDLPTLSLDELDA